VFVVDRRCLEHALDSIDVEREARVVPSRAHQRQVGFKLFAIRPGSIIAALGFRNGDVVRAANGLPLTSIDRAFEAHDRLRRQRVIQVDVERRGTPVRLSYFMP